MSIASLFGENLDPIRGLGEDGKDLDAALWADLVDFEEELLEMQGG
jgi:hypothetical protein